MTKFNNVYSAKDMTDGYAVDAPSDCRIETQSGTVYWLSAPDADGYRSVVREPLPGTATGTLFVQAPTTHVEKDEENSEASEKFRGKLRSEVVVGMSLALEVLGRETGLLSEVVVKIEPGDVPKEIFQ